MPMQLDRSQRRLKTSMRVMSRLTVPLFRLFKGRGASLMSPPNVPPVLLLTTTGRKTGQPRTVALSHFSDGDEAVVVGSYGGLPVEPAWVLNLRANPAAFVETGPDRVAVCAEFLEPPESELVWERIVSNYPVYRKTRERANRDLPIVRLAHRAN